MRKWIKGNWVVQLLAIQKRQINSNKLVLEATPVYWHSFAYIPVGILDKILRKCFNFLWKGKSEKGIPPVKWQRLAKPKAMGGWDLKNIHSFGKALAATSLWRLLKAPGL
jgi:hypothetical protein